VIPEEAGMAFGSGSRYSDMHKNTQRNDKYAKLLNALVKREIKGFHIEDEERTWFYQFAKKHGVLVGITVKGEDCRIGDSTFPLVYLIE
jgi:hypothetical protein